MCKSRARLDDAGVSEPVVLQVMDLPPLGGSGVRSAPVIASDARPVSPIACAPLVMNHAQDFGVLDGQIPPPTVSVQHGAGSGFGLSAPPREHLGGPVDAPADPLQPHIARDDLMAPLPQFGPATVAEQQDHLRGVSAPVGPEQQQGAASPAILLQGAAAPARSDQQQGAAAPAGPEQQQGLVAPAPPHHLPSPRASLQQRDTGPAAPLRQLCVAATSGSGSLGQQIVPSVPTMIQGLSSEGTAIMEALQEHWDSGAKGPFALPPHLTSHLTSSFPPPRLTPSPASYARAALGISEGIKPSVRGKGKKVDWDSFRAHSSTGEDAFTDDQGSEWGVTSTEADAQDMQDVLDGGGLIGSDPDTLVFPQGRAVSDTDQPGDPVEHYETEDHLDDWSVATRSKRSFGRKVIKRNKKHPDQPLWMNLRRRQGGGSGI